MVRFPHLSAKPVMYLVPTARFHTYSLNRESVSFLAQCKCDLLSRKLLLKNELGIVKRKIIELEKLVSTLQGDTEKFSGL